MDSRSCNFTAGEINALLEVATCYYETIVGSFNAAKGGDTNKKKKDVWLLITEDVNAIGSGQRRTTDQIKLQINPIQIKLQATSPLRGKITQMWSLTPSEVRSDKLCMAFKVL